MQVIEITSLNGTAPFDISVCDSTNTYCYNVLSGVMSAPISFNIPTILDGVSQVIVKITDSLGCEDFRVISCPTGTPTPTPTPTITPTIPDTTCLCILFDNPSATLYTVSYNDCNGVITSLPVPGYSLIPVCGSNPDVSGSFGKVTYTIGLPCIGGLCQSTSITLTPTQTPTITPTISVTPSITPTISVTPSITPTISITPSITPTKTITPTITKTPTPTPTLTPSMTPPPKLAYLFIEEQSGSIEIGSWMYNLGYSFYGFTNGTQPTQDPYYFDLELNGYVDFTGWTNGYFPTIITQTVPQTSGGFDSFGNSITAYNFLTTEVPSGTALRAWYTWIIPVNATNNLKQTQIDYSITSPTLLTTVNTESTIHNYTFTYVGTTIPQGTYRVYTTYPGTNFRLLNGSSIYFRGNTVA